MEGGGVVTCDNLEQQYVKDKIIHAEYLIVDVCIHIYILYVHMYVYIPLLSCFLQNKRIMATFSCALAANGTIPIPWRDILQQTVKRLGTYTMHILPRMNDMYVYLFASW